MAAELRTISIADVDGTEKTYVMVATASDNAPSAGLFEAELMTLLFSYEINRDSPKAALTPDA